MAKVDIRKGGYVFVCQKCGRLIISPNRKLAVSECPYCPKKEGDDKK